jgi:ubiquinone/menaquinone biosynthesis C-methylase UbiE
LSFYDRYLLPPCIDFVMRVAQPEHLRREVLSAARGDVLEIGVGSGLNLPHYPQGITSIVGVDPSARLLQLAERGALLRRDASRGAGPGVTPGLLLASAEHLPFPSPRFDTVVSTWTLCSIPDHAAALAEVRRVLRPGGRLVFIEHGLAPDASVGRWQARLTPWWKPLSGGCHLDRRIDGMIADAGFRFASLDTGYQGIRVTGFTYRGVAEALP